MMREYPPHPSLEGALAKISRAAQLRNTLNARIREFKDGDPYGVTVDFDANTGWHVAHARVFRDPTPLLSVIVGEIAYECLSALNHVAWELAARKVGSRRIYAIKNEIQFPIAKQPGDFVSHAIIHKRRISKPALALFEELQPYNGSGGPQRAAQHPLVLMKEVADADKHRTLVTAYGEVGMGKMVWGWDHNRAFNPVTENRIKPGRTLEDGAEISAIRFEIGNENARVYVDGKPSVEVAFLTENWSIGPITAMNFIATADHCYTRLAELFPTRS